MMTASGTRFLDKVYHWLPYCWMILAGTQGFGMLRAVGIHIGGTGVSATAGSPLERTLFLLMFLLAIYLLYRRNTETLATLRTNWPVLLLFCYIAISISWSPLPEVSLKRFIKMCGALSMALLVATDPKPATRLEKLLSNYLWTVLIGSLIVIAFIPEIGRVTNYDGTVSNAGICFSKNGLGQCALAAALLAEIPIICRGRAALRAANSTMLLLAMLVLALSHSSTSLVVWFTTTIMLLLIRLFATATPTFAGLFALFTALLAFSSFSLIENLTPRFSIKNYVITQLGKDPTLTGRTELWHDVWKIASKRPVFGYGTGSFWVGDIGVSRPIMESYDWPPNQAHNGYLDVVAQLGFFGLALLLFYVVWALIAAFRLLPINFQSAMLRVALILCALLLNLTESSFCRITHRVWLYMLLAGTFPPHNTPQPR